MNYVLQTLTEEIYSNLHPAKLLQSGNPAAYEKLIVEAENIQLLFMHQAYRINKKEPLATYVQHCQSGCIDLTNKLEQYSNYATSLSFDKQSKEAVLLFYSGIQNHLISLYCSIKKVFPDYFDTSLPLPGCYWQQEILWLQENSNNVYNFTAGLVNPQLLHTSLRILQTSMNRQAEPCISYRQLTYWKQLLERLQEIEELKDKQKETAMIHLLLALNFNDGHFLEAVMKVLNERVALLESMVEQMKEWDSILKAISRIQPIPGMFLLPNAPGSTSTLITFIQQEITQLEKELLQAAQPITVTTKPMKTSYTVAQLAALLRSMVETGGLMPNTQEELFEFAAAHFRTRKDAAFSPDSVRTKYYSPEPIACSITKDHLVAMTNRVRSF